MKTKEQPLVSIIIPTRNEEKYLPRLLESIKKQTYKNYEVIVADGNSTDKTREIAKKHGAKIVDGKDHPGKGRNQGARHAKGEILLFLDADVILPRKDTLARMVKEFQEENLGVAGIDFAFDKRDRKLEHFSRLVNAYFRVLEKIHPRTPGHCIMVKKSVHEKIGGFNENLKVAEDCEYVYRAAKISRFRILDSAKILVSPRRIEREGGITRTVLKYLSLETCNLLEKEPPSWLDYELGGDQPDKDNPLVSIIIPTKNEEKYLPRLLESIKKQTYKNYEVIVADGNSTDKTREIAKKHGAKIVDGKDHPGKGRNQGARHAKGEILLFLDADTILPTKKTLENMIKEFIERKLDGATVDIRYTSRKKIIKALEKFTNNAIRLMALLDPHSFGAVIMVKKSVHEKIGGFNERMVLCEDHDYAKRIYKNGKWGVLDSAYIYMSPRRIEKEGVPGILSKYLLFELYYLTKREVDRIPLLEYKMGGDWEKEERDLLDQVRRAFTSLDRIEKLNNRLYRELGMDTIREELKSLQDRILERLSRKNTRNKKRRG